MSETTSNLANMEDPGPTAAYRASFPDNADGPIQFEGRDNDDALFEFVDADGETRERENEELYVLLNLPKTASDAEIRDRYRQLAGELRSWKWDLLMLH